MTDTQASPEIVEAVARAMEDADRQPDTAVLSRHEYERMARAAIAAYDSEAAATIERLREALERIASRTDADCSGQGLAFRQIARAALTERTEK